MTARTIVASAEGVDDRTIHAAAKLLAENICAVTVLGTPDKMLICQCHQCHEYITAPHPEEGWTDK